MQASDEFYYGPGLAAMATGVSSGLIRGLVAGMAIGMGGIYVFH